MLKLLMNRGSFLGAMWELFAEALIYQMLIDLTVFWDIKKNDKDFVILNVQILTRLIMF